MSDQPRYLNAQEAADYLRISVSWVRKATRSGELPHAKIGCRVIYDRTDLDEYVRQKKIKASWAAQGVDV